jgi:CheY-like chemotaxis protein
MSALLEKWGCPHHEAPNAEDTLAALRAGHERGQPYRIAILDMQMPDIDGEELGRKIKADESLRETLLVAMTSVGRRGDAVRLRREGFAAYLTKPVKQSLLHDCLATLLSPERLRAAQTQGRIVTRHTVAEDKGRGVRILLAEDNPTNQKVALGILGKFGCRTDAVPNGLKAIQALESVPYDLVFMDCQMPELDGYEATRAIRSPESAVLNHRIPIIAMTANAMQGDRDKCLAAGMDDYLAKPVRPDTLGEMVKKWASAATPSPPHHEKALTSESAAPAIFDRSELVDRMLGDKELAQTVVDGFLGDTPRLIEALRQALRAGDRVLVRREGHSIKGASANVGAPALRNAAHEVEKAGAAGDLTRAASLMPHVEEQFLAFREIVVGEATGQESESP